MQNTRNSVQIKKGSITTAVALSQQMPEFQNPEDNLFFDQYLLKNRVLGQNSWKCGGIASRIAKPKGIAIRNSIPPHDLSKNEKFKLIFCKLYFKCRFPANLENLEISFNK